MGLSSGFSLIPCDAEAYPAQILQNPDQVSQLKLIGGVGTDMREGIEAAINVRKKPEPSPLGA